MSWSSERLAAKYFKIRSSFSLEEEMASRCVTILTVGLEKKLRCLEICWSFSLDEQLATRCAKIWWSFSLEEELASRCVSYLSPEAELAIMCQDLPVFSLAKELSTKYIKICWSFSLEEELATRSGKICSYLPFEEKVATKCFKSSAPLL